MKENLKIFSYVDDLTNSYGEGTAIVEGLVRNPKDIIRTIEFYTNDEYLSGNKDQLGREKPFHNVCNFRVTVAKTATDVDVKDLKYEPDSLDDAVAAMLINHETYNYLKESNFSETLNDMGKTRPKYGGLLVKKTKYEGKLKIEVVDWTNVIFNATDVIGGTIIEKHYLHPNEVAEKTEAGWENVEELIKAHSKANKNKPAKIEICEVTGVFPETFDPELSDTEANEMSYKRMCFYVGVVNKKKFMLYKEDLKDDEDKYKYLPWEKVKLSLGRGVVEEGFQAQIWTNDAVIGIKNAMDLSGKVVLATSSKKVQGNALTGMDNGHIINLEPNATIQSLNLQASNLPEYSNIINLWKAQYDNSVSVHDANTGEAPTAGTPYSQTALLNQVANSPFEYQREVWGIFLNELFNEWVYPHVKSRIMKEHYLVSEFGEEELAIIDEAIQAKNHNQMVKSKLLAGEIVTPEDVANVKNGTANALKKLASKREIKIPEKFLDVKGKLTLNITGELKNKTAVLQSLSQIGRDIMATYNPQTGQFGAMQDPFLRKLYGSIINMAGTPMSSADLKPSTTPMPTTPTAPASTPDMSAPAPALTA
jgi:hypothetical protein